MWRQNAIPESAGGRFDDERPLGGPSTRRHFVLSSAALAGGAWAGAGHLVASATVDGVSALPDVVISELVIPSGTTAGQVVDFGAVVRNQGRKATPNGVIIGVRFYVDGTEVRGSDQHRQSLAAGASVNLEGGRGTGTYPLWVATRGTHTLKAVVNASHRFAEATMTNNSRSVTFTVARAPAAMRPVNLTRPTITGMARVGHVLRASHGSWR